MTNGKPASVSEVQAFVKEAPRIFSQGAGTKTALTVSMDGVATLDMTLISGLQEYEPEEFTFTALAGTRIVNVNQALSKNGQYLPFDPPLVDRGATLGGTVAAGLSGPGRYRYGGVRDFLLGVRYVNSSGELVRGGGKVVKNAAGFDLAKLMIGSLGTLGVFVELTFKVFPAPELFSTLRLDFDTLMDALQALQQASVSHLDIDAIEMAPKESGFGVWIRIGGFAKTLPARIDSLYKMYKQGEILNGSDEESIWQQLREFDWVPGGWSLIKIPMTHGRILALEGEMKRESMLRRYSCAGQIGWLAVKESPESLEPVIVKQGLNGLVILGSSERLRLGEYPSGSFYSRIKTALDPINRFVEV